MRKVGKKEGVEMKIEIGRFFFNKTLKHLKCEEEEEEEMGIPGMYRWFVQRYPETICSVAECDDIDLTQPNPNGVEFDNLYIDLNGIIHPCFNPSEFAIIPPPKSYDEVLLSIQKYIDKVFSIVRPRKLLFLALDGVAPRAKMNHQRIRRFRTAKESLASRPRDGTKKMDSNVITPGTEFMELLSFSLQSYVDYKITNAPEWKHINVILSDSTVVGEGEYKIMSFIRSQRNLPHYDPNTRHCVHGMDADLIMLSLATHEIHFSILREFRIRAKKREFNHRLYPQRMTQFIHEQEFEFFNIWVLREYLERDLLPNVVGTDFERLIDDFVFLCFFVGNDFLPHLPSLDVSKCGIELLLFVYQEEFVKMGYLTNAPEVNLKSMEHFLQALSSTENAISFKLSQFFIKIMSNKKRRGFQDFVKVHKSKLGYYFEKFDCKSHDIDRIKRDAVLKYTEGVCWIMHYYYQGLNSWQWFYPYHYAPLASDFCGLDKIEINFTLGQPLKPLSQLLGVLPAASAQALPLFYRELMTKESSPILDFYPKDAKVDRNGKKYLWQGVLKLPFIDESRLLSEAVKAESTLTDEEKQRNRFGMDKLFVHCLHPLSKFIKEHLLCDPSSKLEIQITRKLSGGVTGYVCISDKLEYTCKIPSVMKLKYINVISVGYKCPSHAHIPKLLSGVIMPHKILRCQNTGCPPVVWHADVSQSIDFESPSEKIQKKKKRKRDEESTDEIEEKDKQDRDEKLINIEICEKASSIISSSREEHESQSLDGELKRRQEKKKGRRKIKGDKLEAQLDIVEDKASNIISSSREEHESQSVDGEPKRKQEKKKKRRKIKGDKLEAQLDLVEVSGGCEKPLNKMEHVKEEDLVERSIGIQVGCLIIPCAEEGEGVSRKIDVGVGESLMECDLVNISCEDKRKEEKLVSVGFDEISGVRVDENMNGFPVSEKKAKKKKLAKAREKPERPDVEKEQTHKVVDEGERSRE